MAEQKTNVMRVLEQKKIPYSAHAYPHGDEAVDGVQVAELIGRPVEQVFKTLVAVGASKKNYVFVIPVDHALDLKKAAKAVGEALGKRALEKGITEVCFDRAGFLYHGRVAALADGAREAGLKF